uniref:TspO/MBR family protein n=1 Tax=Agathobacter sp. TaxID=2021311 RepID=UPI0040564F98
MKIDIRKLISSLALPLLTGMLSGFLSRNAMVDFAAMAKPPLSPPAILFPIVWTILYILMGISMYIISVSDASEKEISDAKNIYFYQLMVNFLWPVFFFNFGWYLFSFFWLLLLWILVFVMIRKFYAISPVAAFLNIPYLLWLTFAGYLNLGVWWLNRPLMVRF